MIAKLLCKMSGHKRGVRIRPETERAAGIVTYRCPRCGETWTRKRVPAKAAA